MKGILRYLIPYNTFFSHTDCSVSETDDYAMKEWLKNHIEPLSQVHEFMEKTTIKRAEWIRANPGLSISSILKEYPRLIDIHGMVSNCQYFW